MCKMLSLFNEFHACDIINFVVLDSVISYSLCCSGGDLFLPKVGGQVGAEKKFNVPQISIFWGVMFFENKIKSCYDCR